MPRRIEHCDVTDRRYLSICLAGPAAALHSAAGAQPLDGIGILRAKRVGRVQVEQGEAYSRHDQ